MPIELVGAAGITTPGVESAAMPTVAGDAVVESGSNSDGEWTRWADGTQLCRKNLFPDSGEVQGNAGDWTFPVSFTGTPQCFGSCATRSASDGTRIEGVSFGFAGTYTATQTEVAVNHGTSGTSVAFQSCLLATDRWK